LTPSSFLRLVVSHSERNRTFGAPRSLFHTTATPKLPFLPVLAKEEKLLFVDLILKSTGGFDADAMALIWCEYVDGVTIFPKQNK
jgi:hypothetical protein